MEWALAKQLFESIKKKFVGIIIIIFINTINIAQNMC